MNDKNYIELQKLIEQMIEDKTCILHGGNIIDWTDTKIPEILEKIKQNQDTKSVEIQYN